MPLMQIKMRARKLIDPLNSHEWVEAEVTYEPDRVFNPDEPRKSHQYSLESESVALDKCHELLYDAVRMAMAGSGVSR